MRDALLLLPSQFGFSNANELIAAIARAHNFTRQANGSLRKRHVRITKAIEARVLAAGRKPGTTMVEIARRNGISLASVSIIRSRAKRKR